MLAKSRIWLGDLGKILVVHDFPLNCGSSMGGPFFFEKKVNQLHRLDVVKVIFLQKPLWLLHSAHNHNAVQPHLLVGVGLHGVRMF